MSTRTLPPGVDDYDNIDMEEEQPAHPGLNVNANTWNPETAFMDRVMTFMENNQRAQTADQRVKLATFWEKDPAAWFDLVEAEMEAKRMFDPHTRYRTVLTAIPVHITERIRGILNQARVAADPFLELKKRLIEMLTPSVLECCESILMGPELGGRRPSELMDTMLAALPVGEPAGYLFKTVFLNRLPADMRDLVALQFKSLGAKELAPSLKKNFCHFCMTYETKKSAAFFCVLYKRRQGTLHSFQKNAKERKRMQGTLHSFQS